MRVRWNNRSKSQLRRVIHYLHCEFGYRKASEFLRDIQHLNKLLSQNPYMGKPEPLLADLHSGYRSIVARYYNKIIYHIVDNNIEVVALWDTRREPVSQAKVLTE